MAMVEYKKRHCAGRAGAYRRQHVFSRRTDTVREEEAWDITDSKGSETLLPIWVSSEHPTEAQVSLILEPNLRICVILSKSFSQGTIRNSKNQKSESKSDFRISFFIFHIQGTYSFRHRASPPNSTQKWPEVWFGDPGVTLHGGGRE